MYNEGVVDLSIAETQWEHCGRSTSNYSRNPIHGIIMVVVDYDMQNNVKNNPH